MCNAGYSSPSPATLRLNRKIRPLFLSEALCPHHCPEHAFDDDFMERADQGEIGDSQFVVVLHQCAEVNVPALDIDRQIGFQVLVVEADDHLVRRFRRDGHHAEALPFFQRLFQRFPVAVGLGLQSERPDQQVAEFEKKRQPAGHRRPECGHEFLRRDAFRAGKFSPEAVGVIGGVLRNDRVCRKRRFVYFHGEWIAAACGLPGFG